MIRRYILEAEDSLKGFNKAIEKLDREWGIEELEPCEDCVSRRELLGRIDAERRHLLDIGMDGAEHIIVHHARRIIEGMPSVKPQRPKGKWIEQNDTSKHHFRWYYCSNCGAYLMSADGANYCSCCGSLNGGKTDGNE